MTLFVDAYVQDWLDLLLRWLHVVAGIVWIGTSFYFVALDSHLRGGRGEVAGESWEIHGGGFYRVQKYRVAPEKLPEPLHWFKWEAYTTWLSGFALLVVLYYLDADTYLVDRSVAELGTGWAVLISLGLLALAWVVYDVLCRLLASQLVLAAVLLALAAAAAWGLGELFSDRAVPIQLGAMLGTMMAGNVLFVIIPGQRELVRAKRAGREPDPAHGIRGKQRSVHNNYLTLPVVLAMIAPHFPFVYTHARAWLVLLTLMVLGAWVRHFFNLRHQGRTIWTIPVTAALGVVALAVAIEPEDRSPESTGPPVPFAQVASIVEERCARCHSGSAARKGVALDTPAQIKAQADAIDEQAVETNAMPLGNATGMTNEERQLLGRWIDQGATIP